MDRAKMSPYIQSVEWISRLAPLYSVIFLSSSVILMLLIFYFETWVSIVCYAWSRSRWLKQKEANLTDEDRRRLRAFTPKKEMDGCGSCVILSTFVSAHLFFLFALFGGSDPAFTQFMGEYAKPQSAVIDQFHLTLLSIVVTQMVYFYERWKITEKRELFLEESLSRIGFRIGIGQFTTIFGGWIYMVTQLAQIPYAMPLLAGLAIALQYAFDRYAETWIQKQNLKRKILEKASTQNAPSL